MSSGTSVPETSLNGIERTFVTERSNAATEERLKTGDAVGG
jgi:hypothetical protein